MATPLFQPVILAGGAGTRLWPASRRDHPKQFATLFGGETLFQSTCRRFADRFGAPPMVIGNDAHRFLIAEQAAAAGLGETRIVLEPAARDTAAAACSAALLAAAEAPERLVILAPSDHLIGDGERFAARIKAGADRAAAGDMVLFGVRPSFPHTGYGYLEVGEGAAGGEPARRVLSFIEKPDRERAERLLASGRYLWNSGIFLFKPQTLLDLFARYQPEILAACRAAVAGAREDLGFLRLDAASYAEAPAVSLDHGIMEKGPPTACVELDCAWSDLGAWPAVREAATRDAAGNAASGDVRLIDTRNSLVHSERQLVVVAGLSDVVVVSTADAVLVASADRAQDLRRVVSNLAAEGREEAVAHPRVHRPWGWYERLSLGDGHQVKRLMVKPGARLSLQSHARRAEHWVVVSGVIEVTRGGEVFVLPTNTSTFIPLGVRHRIANTGTAAAMLIEVQSGEYVGEDDIVRYDDIYGRGDPA